MEKFSAYRDPGTGIQPFLTPVPPVGSDLLAKALLPFGLILGVARTLLALVFLVVYLLLVDGVCLVLKPVPPLHRLITYIFTALISRLTLLLVGIWWIPVEQTTRKRGRGIKTKEPWNPGAGDIIVSNWASWVEVLWLAFRFNPIFVLPTCEAPDLAPTSATPSVAHSPGRRTGTGSANITTSTRTLSSRKAILGFRKVSLISMIRHTGLTPPYGNQSNSKPVPLEEIRKKSDRPIVVFPECTSSNGRGQLRFADVFKNERVPVTTYKVFVMCVRYDPPTQLSPTLAHSVPSHILNPLPHVFRTASSLTLPPISIRLLAPSESPSSSTFLTSEIVADFSNNDVLSESCASLISLIGKMKRTGMGWEDKAAFLEFYAGKSSK